MTSSLEFRGMALRRGQPFGSRGRAMRSIGSAIQFSIIDALQHRNKRGEVNVQSRAFRLMLKAG